MAIPDYQTIMLPLLQQLGDGQSRSNSETLESLSRHFRLSEEERKELLASGRMTVFSNRVAWAKVYLKKANLISSPERGVYQITARGQEVLAQNPDQVNNAFLMRYPEFTEFLKNREGSPAGGTGENGQVDEAQTPQEKIEEGYTILRQQLASELLERIGQSKPDFFERLVVELLVKMGYGGSRADAGKTLGMAGDGGVDGVIKEDKLGLDRVYIQAKRWSSVVGRPEIQKFAGALQGQKATKGVFITNSNFSKEALEYAAAIQSQIVLIDGEQLVNLMIDHDLGVSTVSTYQVKKMDSDYFDVD